MASTVLAKMAVQISADTAKFGKSLDGVEKQLTSFGRGLTNIATSIGLAFGVKEVVSFGFEVAKLAGEAKGVKDAFDRLPESKKLIEDLTEATAGTVAELDLMKRSVQAQNFGIALESLPELLKFAAIRAQQTGQSVDYLVDSIITGIGRKSPLILDNLGISAVRLKEQFGGAALEAQSIGDVAKAVGRIATDELTKMGDFSENTSTKVARLSASWENFKVVLGNVVNSSGLLSGALDVVNDNLERLARGPALIKALELKLASGVSRGSVWEINNATEALKELRIEAGQPLEFSFSEMAERFKLTGDQADKLRAKFLEINDALSRQENVIKQFNEFAKRNGYKDLTVALNDYKNSLYKNILAQQLANDKVDDSTEAGKREVENGQKVIGYIRQRIDILNKYVGTAKSVETVEKSNIVTLDSLQEKLKELNTQFESLDVSERKSLSNKGQEIISTQALIDDLERLRKKKEEIKKLDEKPLTITNSTGILSGQAGQFAQGSKGGDFLGDFNKGNSERTEMLNKQLKELKLNAPQAGNAIRALEEQIALSMGINIPEQIQHAIDSLDRFSITAKDTSEKSKKVIIDMSGLISGAISEIAYGFGEAAAGVGKFGDVILKAIIGFAKQFGEILIGLGIAALAAQKVATSPQGAIIAGVALVALAGAASAALARSQKGYNSGSSGRSSGAAVDQGRLAANAQPSYLVADTVIRGKDIYLVWKQYQSDNQYTSSMNG